MRTQTVGVWLSSLLLAASACNSDADDEPAKPTAARPVIEQVPPPLDLKEPPKDATRTGSGLIYKKLVAREAGEPAKQTDTVMVRYTGWQQRTGQTFFTTNRGGEAMGIDVAYASSGFGEALQHLRKGEKAVLWVPPGQGSLETLVYEVEVVDIKSPTAVASKVPDKGTSVARSQQPMSSPPTTSPLQQAQQAATSPQPATNAQKPRTSAQSQQGTSTPPVANTQRQR